MKSIITISVLLYAFILSSCGQKRESLKAKNDSATYNGRAEEDFRSQEIATEIEKVDLARKMEPYLDLSVADKWSANEWKSKFGPPTYQRSVGDGVVILEYVQPGPYVSGGKPKVIGGLITGVEIYLKGGNTYKWEWFVTKFGGR